MRAQQQAVFGQWKAPRPWDLFQVLPSWLCPVTFHKLGTGWAGRALRHLGKLQTGRGASFSSGRPETYRRDELPLWVQGSHGLGALLLAPSRYSGRKFSFCDIPGSGTLRGQDLNHTLV